MNRLYLVIVLAGCAAMSTAFAQGNAHVPGWVKDTAMMWGQGAISDSEFVAMLQFLLDEGIITVPADRQDAIDAKIQQAYDRGYADGKETMQNGQNATPSGKIIYGTVTRNIDGNTIEVSGERIRSPFVWVEDSGNKTADHAMYARELCPAGSAARYDIDDYQPVGKYGRTIAMVWCDGQEKSLDQLMVESGLGWINSHYCQRSEFRSLDWVNDCKTRSQ